MKTILFLCWIALSAMSAFADSPAAPTFQELMDPALFPEPQMGMAVESAQQKGQALHVRTTGADIHVDPAGKILFLQRIGHERPLATLDLGRPLEGVTLTHSQKGFARITIEKPKMTLRINGDSLFMLHAHEPLSAAVNRQIEVAWSSSFEANHLLADEWGAFGLYCSQLSAKDGFDALSPTVARYPLGADDVLWVGVCPPKPYDWERSLSDNVVWHWSRESAYPPDDALAAWSKHGNIVLLQAELMLWKDWNLAFIPRLGVEEFSRVRKTVHDRNMRFIVYTSPYYFLKGTALEPRAFNTFENFKSWPPGTPTGENMGLFMPEIKRVMAEYKPDGLYFDGQYIHNPAALYALARSARDVVGEDGILEWHSTHALGSQRCYLPQADAYVDFILRGEGRANSYSDFDYLRFFVSGYNIHNSIGVICNNGAAGLTPELAKNVLRANARTHTIVSWLNKPDIMKTLKEVYEAGLTPELRKTVEAGIDARQAKVMQKAERKKRKRKKTPPNAEKAEGIDKTP